MPPLLVEDVEHLRSAPSPYGIAPYTSSDLFKSQHAKSKPKSQSLHRHLSMESRRFGGSPLKQSASLNGDLGIIHLGTGRPHASLYPWDSIVLGLSPYACQIESLRKSVDHSQRSLAVEPEPIARQGDLPHPRKNLQAQRGYDLGTALNYGNAVGSPALVRFLSEHIEIVHNPPYSDWNICLTCGSTSSIETALRIFCNPGETVLVEEYTYPGFKDAAALIGIRVQGVAMDSDGLRSEILDGMLSTWDSLEGRKPSVLYTIPSGQNPTGCTQPEERRRAIYNIAKKHDLVIIEDDPYFFLDLGSIDAAKTIGDAALQNPNNSGGFLSSLPRSFLSLDSSGRVVRLDSTSKILSPGLRIGWVTASSQIIAKYIAYNETNAVAASGPSQFMLYEIFEHSWGHGGFWAWLANLSLVYYRRREIVQNALEKYLPPYICQWNTPRCGMFIWLRLNLDKHPNYLRQDDQLTVSRTIQASEIEARIASTVLDDGVEITKGSLFAVDMGVRREAYLRLTFAAAAEGELEEGIRIVAKGLKKEFGVL